MEPRIHHLAVGGSSILRFYGNVGWNEQGSLGGADFSPYARNDTALGSGKVSGLTIALVLCRRRAGCMAATAANIKVCLEMDISGAIG